MLSLYSPPYPSPTLLRDLDIPISHTDLEKIIDRDISYKTIITHHGPSTILSIFDKLRITKILNRLITDDITPSSPTNCIINHTLPDDLIIISYTKRYTILYNNATTISTKICNKPLWNTTASYDTIPSLVSEISLTTPKPFGNYLITTRNNINNAVKNGMHIVKATIDCAHATNADIISCTAIQELNADHCKFITSCAPFASTLRKLSVRNNLLGSSIHPVDANEHRSDPYGINDKALKLCTSLTDLNADNNDNITTCKPFAHTLRKLSACRMSQICDAGLRSCTALESLDASRNDRITTCEPFANTLRILFATQYCGISDAGLAANTRIEKLDASHNRKITSCAPFASTLRILIAANTCGISDEGLQLCTAITELHATDNNKITTCAPFAHTLKILYANVTTLTCGITDIGLSKCGFIEYLNADSNQNITTQQ